MKTKSAIWLSICTLVLCFGVMTIGVYSAISANLKMGGTLGFNMHNALIEVSGTINNIAKTEDNWTSAYLGSKTIERVVFGGENTTTTNLNIGELYFHKLNSSSAYDIIFEITFTNISEKSLKATLPMPEVGANVTLLHNDDTNGYVDFTNSYQTVVAKGNSFTIKFALQLNDISNISQNISFDWNNLIFEEYKLNLVKYDEAKNYYYIEMGTNPYRNDEPLRWFAYAQRKTDGTLEYIPNSVEPTSNNTYYFISELVLKTENTSSIDSGGVPYQNNYKRVTPPTNPSYITGTSYEANSYGRSTIRKYLNGETVYNSASASGNVYSESGTEVNIDFYNITTSDIYKNYITPRPLSEICSILMYSYDLTDDLDKLWLLPSGDVGYVNVQDDGVVESTNYNSQTGEGTQTFSWYYLGWTSNTFNMQYFGIDELSGTFTDNSTGVNKSLGVRPAFQITIP